MALIPHLIIIIITSVIVTLNLSEAILKAFSLSTDWFLSVLLRSVYVYLLAQWIVYVKSAVLKKKSAAYHFQKPSYMAE